jgi:hypothetical protein
MEKIEGITLMEDLGIGNNNSGPRIITHGFTESFDPQLLYQRQLDDLANRELLLDKPTYNFHKAIHFTQHKHDILTFIGRGEVIAGSTMCRLINTDIEAKDVDVYFHNEEDVLTFIEVNKSELEKYSKAHGCGYAYFKRKGLKYNLIWGIPYENAEDLISGFDIRACAIAYEPLGQKMGRFMAIEGALADCISKRIVYQTTARAISINRLLKYIKKGFNIDKYQRCILAELIKSGHHSPEIEINTGY